MKNLLLLLPFFFLFFQKINGQTESRLTKKVTEQYSDSLNIWIDVNHELYEYDTKGNLISESEIDFDENGEIMTWVGFRYEYDVNDLLLKRRNGRYNWELGIWITQSWTEYIYENNCLIKRLNVPNSVIGNPNSEVIMNDAGCLEIAYTAYNSEEEFRGRGEIEYDDKNRIINLKRYFYVEQIDSLYLSSGLEQQFNDENDRELYFDYTLWGSGNFFDYTHQFFEYDYEYYSNGLLHKKYKTTAQIIYPFGYRIQDNDPPEPVLFEEAEIEYHYSCEDILEREEISFEQFESTGESFLGKRRILYSYEGDNPCFDFENKSTASIYPNPTSGNVQIDSPLFASGNTQIRVFDIDGELLLEKIIISREEENAIDVGFLSNGTYVIQLVSGEHFVSKKLVVVK